MFHIKASWLLASNRLALSLSIPGQNLIVIGLAVITYFILTSAFGSDCITNLMGRTHNILKMKQNRGLTNSVAYMNLNLKKKKF